MVHFIALCKQCKSKRTYEGKTFGEASDAAYADGWRYTGQMTYMVCKGCGSSVDVL